MKQILRKLMKRTVDGNTETLINERIEKELLTTEELQELIDQFGDDCEAAFCSYGLMIDYSDEVCGITLDTLATGLDEFLKDENEYDSLQEIKNKIEPWRAYDLDFENEPVKP